MRKTVAVLGATGFLGRPLCDWLHAHKVKLFLCSRNGGSFEGIRVGKIDLSIDGTLENWLKPKRVDSVFYLSAVISKDFATDPFSSLARSLAMHTHVCRAWIKRKFHLIYASGAAVYGDAAPPWREDGAVAPLSYYALSKLIGEQVLSLAAREHRLPLTVLRICAPFGMKARNKTVVNIFMERALSGQDLELYGSGQREQDFISDKDVAVAFGQALLMNKTGTFNISSGRPITMERLARMIIRLTGSSSRVIFNGQKDPQEGKRVRLDVQKARRELDFSMHSSLEAALRKMADQYVRRDLSD